MFFQLEDMPSFPYFPDKKSYRNKMVDLKVSVSVQKALPLKLRTYMLSMALSYATTEMTLKDSHKISMHNS